MRRTGIAVLVVAVLQVIVLPQGLRASEISGAALVFPRVVGGSPASIGDAPWQVALIDRSAGSDWYGQFCGGSILSATWVITAAHCLDWGISAKRLMVLSGSDFLTSSGLTGIQVRRFIIHPAWNPSTNENDVGLIELTRPITLNPGIAERIALPAATPVVGSMARVTGWGNTSSVSSVYPDYLQKAEVEIFSDAYCQSGSRYGSDYEADLMVCAGAPDFSRDTCQGDSGGPLAVFVADHWELQGVTSFGVGCAQAPYPGVYAEIYPFAGWIRSVIVPAPVVSSIVPTAGTVGEVVSVLGRNLADVETVRLAGVVAAFTISSDTVLTFEVPSGASSGQIEIVNAGATTTYKREFRVIPPVGWPQVTRVAPSNPRVGSTVTITGGNLLGTTAVTFGGVPSLVFTVISSTSLTAVVPVGAATGRIAITNALGTTVSDLVLRIRR